jgi:hypothetical protein
MVPLSVRIAILVMQFVPYFLVLHGSSLLDRCVLTFSSTPQHDRSRRCGKDPVRTLLSSRRKSDLSRLHTFGRCVYVEPPRARRPAKPEVGVSTGIFLGLLFSYSEESAVLRPRFALSEDLPTCSLR